MSELPKGWHSAPMRDVVELKYGKSLPKDMRRDGPVPVFGSNGVVGRHNQAITSGPTIIIGRKGSIGEVHVSTNACFPIDTTYYLDSFGALDFDFAKFLLKTLPLTEMNRATAIPGLNREDAYDLEVLIPPIGEQRRIVAKIDSLSAKSKRARDHLEHVPQLVRKYKEAVLVAAFNGQLTKDWRLKNQHSCNRADISISTMPLTKSEQGRGRKLKQTTPLLPDQIEKMWQIPTTWRWRQVGDCAFVTKLAGFEYTKFVKYDPSGDLRVLKAENAGPDGFRATNYSCVRSSEVQSLSRSKINGGEILVVFVGAGTGNVALVPRDENFFLGPNIGMIRADDSIVKSEYIELFFRSPGGRSLLLSTVKAVAQPSLSMGAIRSTPLAFPEISEQEEILRRVIAANTWIDRVAAEAASARKLIDHLDQAVLSKAFRGELVPQDPDDEPASALLKRIKAEGTGAAAPRRGRGRPRLAVT